MPDPRFSQHHLIHDAQTDADAAQASAEAAQDAADAAQADATQALSDAADAQADIDAHEAALDPHGRYIRLDSNAVFDAENGTPVIDLSNPSYFEQVFG